MYIISMLISLYHSHLYYTIEGPVCITKGDLGFSKSRDCSSYIDHICRGSGSLSSMTPTCPFLDFIVGDIQS